MAWGSNPGFMSNKPTHYLLAHSDFKGIEDLHSTEDIVMLLYPWIHFPSFKNLTGYEYKLRLQAYEYELRLSAD